MSKAPPLPVPMLQLCGEQRHIAKVMRAEVDGRAWFFASNGQAMLLVAATKNASRLTEFDPGVATKLSPGPAYAVAWHDLQSWLRERAESKECWACDGTGKETWGSGMRRRCDCCDGTGREATQDYATIAGVCLDRNLVARYLAPVFAPSVMIHVSPCAPETLDHIERQKAQRPTMLRAADDSWRVYVMPCWMGERWSSDLPWFPLGMLEAA